MFSTREDFRVVPADATRSHHGASVKFRFGGSTRLLNSADHVVTELGVDGVCVRESNCAGKPARRRRVAPFAAIGATTITKSELRTVFNEIDSEKKGVITEGDLRSYVSRKGMPQAYVGKFMEASGGKQGKLVGVSFTDFSNYVQTTEDSIKNNFRAIDLDGDGKISTEDLQIALERTSACCTQKCPSNRRTTCSIKGKCVDNMMVKMNPYSKTVNYREFRDFFLLLPTQEVMYKYWVEASCAVDINSSTQVLANKPKQHGNPAGHLLAGALAGAVSRTVTAPLETLRITMMLDGGGAGQKTAMGAAREIYRRGGMRALFAGNATNVMRSAPQKAIDFFAFEGIKGVLARGAVGGALTSPHTLMAGAMAGACSNVALYPLDAVRSRLTVDTAGQYKGVFDALKKVTAREGTASLYRGLPTSVMAILPEAAITYGMYDILRKSYKRVVGEEAGVIPSLCAGVSSAFTGQLVAYPLELVARRLQVQTVGAGAGGYRGVADAIPRIIAEEGPGALYKGIVPASIKVIPMAAVSFAVYEATRATLLRLQEEQERREWRREHGMVDGEHIDVKAR